MWSLISLGLTGYANVDKRMQFIVTVGDFSNVLNKFQIITSKKFDRVTPPP